MRRFVHLLLLFACLGMPWRAELLAQAGPSRVAIEEGSLTARYRAIDSSAGVRTVSQVQDKVSFRARLSADTRHRLSLNIGAFSGSTLTGSWNNTGLGTGTHTLGVFVKQFYVAAVPVTGVEAQVGSLYVARGESTEITSYDNDAYLTGERVAIRVPRHLLVDAVSVTNAYLGDVAQPNAFRRLDRLGDANYQQVLVDKRVGSVAFMSADWTHAPGGATWRGAVRVPLPGPRNMVRLELYRRVRDHAGGMALSTDRGIGRRIVATAGFASVDPVFPLNGDRYGRGRRVFAAATASIAPALSVSFFATQAFHSVLPNPSVRRWEVLVGYNVLAAVANARDRHRPSAANADVGRDSTEDATMSILLTRGGAVR